MSSSAIHPIYQPFGEGGRFLVFAGDLEVAGNGALVPGQVELELHPSVELRVHVIGPGAVSARVGSDADGETGFLLPADADLTPPDEAALSDREEASRAEFHATQIRAGRIDRSASFLFHVSGALEALASPRPLRSGGLQPQVNFSLPGWELVLVPGIPTHESRDFAAIVAATPTAPSVAIDDVDRLHRWLFILLSFIANREVGIGPVCGLDAEGEVMWAEWTNPRMKAGKSGVTWCPPLLVSDALPELADGMGAVAADPDLEVIVDRAIGYSLAANGEEVIEVRIPIVCSGLELLAWAILQREDWLVDVDARRRLGTAATVRLLLKWAGIPTAVPPSLPILNARLRECGQPGWEGPEILFNIRNAMVHPPKHLNKAEWPDGELLFEAWQLGTWYLELALLRTLGYEGEYWSRARLNRPGVDLEPVPWASAE